MTMLAKALTNIPIFSSFDFAELDQISRIFIRKYFTAGDIFIREGESGNAFYILLDGMVTEYCPKKGCTGKMVVKTLSKGAILGLMSILDLGAYDISCHADENITVAECLIVDYQKFD